MQKISKLLMFTFIVLGVTGILWTQMGASSPSSMRTSVNGQVELIYEFRAQDGTLLRTESYIKNFNVTENENFVDDYSTATRLKEFSAVLERNGKETMIRINWFSDVSVFDSVDFNTSLILDRSQKQGRLEGSQTFSSTPGHTTVFYKFLGVRN